MIQTITAAKVKAADCAWVIACRLRATSKVGKTKVEITGSAKVGVLYGTTQNTEQDAPSMDIVSLPPEQQMEEYRRLCRLAGIDIDASLEALDKSTETTDAR